MSPFRLLTLVVAALLVVVGVLVAFDVVGVPTPEPSLRVTIGVILVLMGVYRGVVGWNRDRGANGGPPRPRP
jgi:uncharacterized membrane protein HdeD (DUF308 family)